MIVTRFSFDCDHRMAGTDGSVKCLHSDVALYQHNACKQPLEFNGADIGTLQLTFRNTAQKRECESQFCILYPVMHLTDRSGSKLKRCCSVAYTHD